MREEWWICALRGHVSHFFCQRPDKARAWKTLVAREQLSPYPIRSLAVISMPKPPSPT
jgi:hypothetical protein